MKEQTEVPKKNSNHGSTTEISSLVNCPNICNCNPGKHPMGKELDENGNCNFFCSSWNECGDSPKHRAGQDCTSCLVGTVRGKGWFRKFNQM